VFIFPVFYCFSYPGFASCSFWSEVEVLTLSIIPPRDVFFPLLKKLKQLRSIDASSSGVDEFYG